MLQDVERVLFIHGTWPGVGVSSAQTVHTRTAPGGEREKKKKKGLDVENVS